MEILASRMLLRPADYERSLAFYRDDLGLAIARELAVALKRARHVALLPYAPQHLRP